MSTTKTTGCQLADKPTTTRTLARVGSLFMMLVALLLPSLTSQAAEQDEAFSPYIIEATYQTNNRVDRETISTEEMPFKTPTQCKSGLNNSVLRMHALSELARKKHSHVTLGCKESTSTPKTDTYLSSTQLFLYQDQTLIPSEHWMEAPPYVVLQEVVIGKESEDAEIGIAMIKQEPFDGILYSSLTGSELACDAATKHDYIIQMKLQRFIYNEGAIQLDLNCFEVNKKGNVKQLSTNSIDIASLRRELFGDEEEYLDDECFEDDVCLDEDLSDN